MKKLPRRIDGPGSTRWRIRWKRPSASDEAYALCLFADKTIQISPDLDDDLMLAAVVDEVAHAHFPALDNDAVDGFSDAVAALLVKMGYKRETEDA
jgi:hypothetical protein